MAAAPRARRLAIALVATAAAAEATEQPPHDDRGWELRVTNSAGPQERACFHAPGLPGYARGLYFIAGPAKFDGAPAGEWRYQSIFDGFGMVNRFELNPADRPPGAVCYSSAWMNTKVRRSYESDPSEPPRGILFEDTKPSRKQCLLDLCDYEASNDNMWINMMVVGGEAVWFSDMPRMLSMDMDTLEIRGLKTWADDASAMGMQQPDWTTPSHIGGGGSAHPMLRPGTSSVIEVMTEVPLGIGSPYTDIYTFDASVRGNQSRQRLTRIKEDQGGQYFHSFGVTPNFVVLVYDLGFDVGIGHEPFLLKAFRQQWKGVHVHDLNGNVQVFSDLDPFMHVHIANTFENSTGVVVDLGAYDEVPFQDQWGVLDIEQSLNKSLRDRKPCSLRSQVRRLHLNNVTGKASVENLTETGYDYDFLKVNPSFAGLPYCVYYAVEWFHNRKDAASMAIMKHDICEGKKSYWSRPNTYVNEPFFVARSSSGSEDDGMLAFTANDGNVGRAMLVVLDAVSFTEMERVYLPHHIPFTAHGSFVPTRTDTVLV